MNKIAIRAAFLAVLSVCVSPTLQADPAAGKSSAAAGKSRQWNFDGDAAGKAPAGFVQSVGRWRVVADKAAPSGGQVVEQQAANPDEVFNVALAKDTSYTDVDISVRLRAVAGRIDQGGGVVWRARDAKNYYIARYNPLEDNFRVYYVKDGHRRMLKSVRLRIDHKAWHTLRVVMLKDHIACYLDGKKHLDAHDGTFKAQGRVGLWAKSDAKTRFDDLQVRIPAGD